MSRIGNYLLIAIALSMDAFSISIGLETNKLLTRNKKIYITILIGIFHFLMPLLGSFLTIIIPGSLDIIANYILAIIFFILGIEILFGEEETCEKINNLYILLISITVSIDSFTIGLGLSLIKEYQVLASLIFSITSMLFTIAGLLLGKYINRHLKQYTNIIGSLILFALALKYLFHL